VAITPSEQPVSNEMWCPYCGKQAWAHDFMPEQMARAEAAMRQVAERYMVDKFDKMLRDTFGKHSGGRNSGISFQYRPAPRAPFRRSPPSRSSPPAEP
jgi:hypothetical protein